MAHKIPRIIEWVTSIHDLEPGDVIATGTNHRGNHHRTFSAFQDGDTIDVEVQGLGTEQFSVRYALKRTWGRHRAPISGKNLVPVKLTPKRLARALQSSFVAHGTLFSGVGLCPAPER